MAPSKRAKAVNKKHTTANEFHFNKHMESPRKSRRKRKVSDMLGSQWTKGELERFYKAFRKLGQDWEKVSASVRTRSPEMVEALYTMNRAYLSLPRSHASVAGLIAMMTDHYSNLGESESDRDITGIAEASGKPLKRPRGSKVLEGKSSSHFASSKREEEGCLSLLMNRRCASKPWAVGKRTPRVPVSFLSNNDKRETTFSPLEKISKSNGSLLDDVTHEIALALAEASQRGGSPQVSRTATEKVQLQSPSKDCLQTQVESEMVSTQLCGEDPEETCSEISLGSPGGTGTTPYSKECSSFRTKRTLKAMPGMDASMRKLLDDMTKTRIIKNDKRLDGMVKMNQFGVKYSRSPRKGLRKNTNEGILTEDNDSSFQALQALADLSLRLPESTADTESTAGVKDEIDTSINPLSKQGTRKRRRKHSDNDRILDVKTPSVLQTDGFKQAALEVIKLESKQTETGVRAKLMSAINVLPRNRRKLKTPKIEIEIDRNSSDGALSNNLSMQKAKIANCLSWYKVRRWCTYEMFCSAVDSPWFAKREFVEYLNHVGLGHIPKLTQVEWGVIRSSLGKPRRFSEQFLKEEKEKLYLYRESVRQHNSELRSGILTGLPPRRSSDQILEEEREKLCQRRESVRKHNSELWSNILTDLVRPLSVGQRVLAIHPKSREIHDGSVLTVDHNRCIIQFDQRELGVEFVLDVDCMPLNALPQKPFATNDVSFGAIRGNHYGVQTENGNRLNPNGSDLYPLSELNRALDETVVSMNDEMGKDRTNLMSSEPFKTQCVSVNLEVSQANEQVSSLCLRQRNAYYDSDIGGRESAGLVESSRSQAKCMVAAAIHSIPKDSDKIGNIEEALDVVNELLARDDFAPGRVSVVGDSVQIPSKLISECVATLLMIQRCTERQFPPGDVAQLLDSAVSSLTPFCPQNIPIYSEIQKCMGIIKNKILALVPT